MYVKMRRNFAGVFSATDRGNGAWRLDSLGEHEVSIFLENAAAGAADVFSAAPIQGLDIEWHADSAQLTFASGGRSATVKTAGVIIHEPLRSLYDSLPLARIDEEARRFWRRVFRVVRIPGGRYLLRLLTRSRRH
jgi:hypothetical protein